MNAMNHSLVRSASPRLRGVLAPVLTPFTDNLTPDVDRFIAHCRWLLSHEVGLAIFGTNSEAASLAVDERLRLTDALLDAGIPAASMMPGTGGCSIIDAVTLTRHAVEHGAAGVLMLPPFFYKGVSDDGIFAYYAEIIERIGDERLAIYLYHIPQVTQVPISLALIERLLVRYPHVVAGAKDSSGDWNNTKAMIDQFGSDGFDVFPASESFLSRAMPLGAAGCISATVNVNPAAIRELHARWRDADAPALQSGVGEIRKIFQSQQMISAMKYALSAFRADPAWQAVRPPLTQIAPAEAKDLMQRLSKADFSMPGLPRQ
jgi:4-hydroxy-tetrahydrodipicolinate synthase